MNGSEDQVSVLSEAGWRRRVRKEGVQASQSSSVGNMVGDESLSVYGYEMVVDMEAVC